MRIKRDLRDLWLLTALLDDFKPAVLDWLKLCHRRLRLIAGVGDQVPSHTDEDRIRIMRDMVEEYGRY